MKKRPELAHFLKNDLMLVDDDDDDEPVCLYVLPESGKCTLSITKCLLVRKRTFSLISDNLCT